jgi:acyl-CoA thioesterase I
MHVAGVHLMRGAVALAIFLFAASAYSASKTILVLGDSLSAEYGIARGAGWVSLLEQRLQTEGLSARVINASISGETTSGGRTRLPALLKQHQPDIVIIELGGNDGLRGLPLNAVESNLREMIKMSQQNKARVLLAGMQIPPNYGRDYTERFSAIYPKLARDTKTALVPFFLEGVAENTQLFQGDRIHPAAEAQPIMLDNVWTHLKPKLIR